MLQQDAVAELQMLAQSMSAEFSLSTAGSDGLSTAGSDGSSQEDPDACTDPGAMSLL